MILEQCKGVHFVDLGESFQTHSFLQILASIQPRTSPVKFAYNLTDRAESALRHVRSAMSSTVRSTNLGLAGVGVGAPANFRGLVLGCIEAKFCKKICV